MRVPQREREEPSAELDAERSGALPKAALVASFGLAFVGWLTLIVGLFFMSRLSP